MLNSLFTTTRPTLLEKLAQGEESELWQEFVDQYTSPVFAFLVGIKKLGINDAEELTQRVMISMFKRLSGFKYEPNEKVKFRNYLIKCANNAFKKEKMTLAKAKEQPLQDDEAILGDYVSKRYDYLNANSVILALDEEFEEESSLEKNNWEIFKTYFIEQLSRRETALRFEVSELKVKNLLQRFGPTLEKRIRKLEKEQDLWLMRESLE